MRKIYILLFVTSAIYLTSCTSHWDYEFEDMDYGFDTEIHEYSKGYVMMKVDETSPDIQLCGVVEVRKGRVDISVILPNGNTVFEKNIADSAKIVLDENFTARKGYWKLKYRSIDGEGFINLHLNQ